MNNYNYKRILLKISGETLKGNLDYGYEINAINKVVKKVGKIIDEGVEVALVVGAGNVWRGIMGDDWNMNRTSADYMGMLATVMNAISLRDAFENAGFACTVQTSIPMEPVAERYNRNKAIKSLEKGEIIIFAAGTGSPFFTTDTTASLRALEIDAQAVLKATKVNGIYDSDPRNNPDAKRYKTLSYNQALIENLAIMDSTAFSMCKDNELPIIVFDFFEDNSIEKALQGDTSIATIVS